MNVPGFSAEASLYKTGERYNGLRAPATLANGVAQVLPQFCYRRGGYICCWESHTGGIDPFGPHCLICCPAVGLGPCRRICL